MIRSTAAVTAPFLSVEGIGRRGKTGGCAADAQSIGNDGELSVDHHIHHEKISGRKNSTAAFSGAI